MSEMPDLSSVTTFIQLLSGFLVSITALVAAIIGIFKPLRTWFGKMLDKFKNTEINDRLNKLETSVESIGTSFSEWKADMQVRFDKDSAEQALLKDATIASTRNFLTEIYNRAVERGYIGDWDRENFERMYKVYSDMGGNSYIHACHDKIIDMPSVPVSAKKTAAKKTTKKKKK